MTATPGSKPARSAAASTAVLDRADATPHEVAAAVVAAIGAGVAPARAASRLCVARLHNTPQRLHNAWITLDDALRAAAEAQHDRAALPVAIAAGLLVAAPATIYTGEGRASSLDAPEIAGDPVGAALTVRAMLAADSTPAAVETALVAWLYRSPTRLGHLAPLVAAVVSLRASVEPEAGADLLASLAATMAEAAAVDPGPLALAHAERIAPILAAAAQVFAAEEPSKAAAFQEPRFRAHLVDGDPATAERALAKALAFGVPRALVCGSLALAAAERLLRFDEAVDASPYRRETWADVAWLLRLCEAARRLEVRHCAPGWLGLALYCAWAIQVGAALDAPIESRLALPEPLALPPSWDHGPEVARVVLAMQRGDATAAMGALRAYLLMGLPETPLGSAMIEAALTLPRAGSVDAQVAAVGLASSAVDAGLALGTHPHRERVWAAALRALAAPRADNALATLVLTQLGGATASTSVPWPWLATHT